MVGIAGGPATGDNDGFALHRPSAGAARKVTLIQRFQAVVGAVPADRPR